MTLNWTNPTDADLNQVVITWTPTGGSPAQPLNVNASAGQAGSAVITGLTNGTQYTFTLRTRDNSSNMSSGATRTATPIAPVKPSLQSVSDFKVFEGDMRVLLSWRNPPDTQVTSISISVQNMASQVVTTITKTARPHQPDAALIEALSNDTHYLITLQGIGEGNKVSGEIYRIATPRIDARNDSTPPNDINNYAVSGRDNELILSWTNSTETDLAMAIVSQLPSETSTTPVLQIPIAIRQGEQSTATISNLPAGNSYWFRIQIADVFANISTGVVLPALTPPNLAPRRLYPVDTRPYNHLGVMIFNWTAPPELDISTTRITWKPFASSEPLQSTEVATTPSAQGRTTITGLKPNTYYEFRFIAVDQSRNQSEHVIRRVWTHRTQAYNIHFNPVVNNAARVLFSTPFDPLFNRAMIEWREGTSLVGSTEINTNRHSLNSLNITGLSAETTYTVSIALKDTDGVDAPASTASLTTTSMGLPRVSGAEATVLGNSITLRWDPVTRSPLIAGYRIIWDDGGQASTQTDLPFELNSNGVIFDNLQMNALHFFAIHVRGILGNIGPALTRSASTTGNVLRLSDVTNLTATPLDGAVRFNWATPNDANICCIQINNTIISNIPLGQPFSHTISGLTNGRAIPFTIHTVTSNHVRSRGIHITRTPRDNIPPAEVTSLSTTPGEGEFTLSWINPPQNDLHAVEVSWTPPNESLMTQRSIQVTHSSTRNITIPNISNGVNYAVTVKTRDRAGNLSTGVNITSRSTTPVEQIAPPNVTNLTASISNGNVTLKWNNPTVADLSTAAISWTPAGGTIQQPFYVRAMSNTSGQASITGLTNGTIYTFTVRSRDVNRNQASGASVMATPRAIPKDITQLAIIYRGSHIALNWMTPSDATTISQILVNWTPSEGMPAPPITLAATPGELQSTFISNMTASSYTFTIKTVSTQGLLSPGVTAKVISSNVDNVPPGLVRNISVGVEGNIPFLQWTNPRSVDLRWVIVSEASNHIDFEMVTPTRVIGILNAIPNGLLRMSLHDAPRDVTLTYSIQPQDWNGNLSEKTLVRFIVRDASPPRAPHPVSVAYNHLGTMRFNWTAPPEVAVSAIRATWKPFASSEPLQSTEVATTPSAQGQTTITGLKPNTYYEFRFITVDQSGNQSEHIIRRVWTHRTQAYNIHFNPVVNNAARMLFSTPFDPLFNRAVIEWRVGTSTSLVGSTEINTNRHSLNSLNITGLSDETTYTVSIALKDTDGVVAPATSAHFTTTADTLLAPTGVTITSRSPDLFIITWNTVSTGRVKDHIVTWSPSTSYAQPFTVPFAQRDIQIAIIPPLASNTEYTFTIVARDIFNNMSPGTTTTGRTLVQPSGTVPLVPEIAPFDILPPSDTRIRDFIGLHDGKEIALRWVAPDLSNDHLKYMIIYWEPISQDMAPPVTLPISRPMTFNITGVTATTHTITIFSADDYEIHSSPQVFYVAPSEDAIP